MNCGMLYPPSRSVTIRKACFTYLHCLKSMSKLKITFSNSGLRPLLLPRRKKKEIAFSITSRTLLMEELKLNNNIDNSFLQRIIAKISRWCLEMKKKKRSTFEIHSIILLKLNHKVGKPGLSHLGSAALLL